MLKKILSQKKTKFVLILLAIYKDKQIYMVIFLYQVMVLLVMHTGYKFNNQYKIKFNKILHKTI